jgi:predicted lipoprotein with Yx(FWY)xxD motif
MTRSRPITFLASAAVVPLTALAVSACGGGGAAATAASSPPTSSATTTAPKTPAVRAVTSSLGSILVDSQGRTLYLFKADSATMSACTGACATAWPPLLANGKPTAGGGLSASKLGTIMRSGGQEQVAYNGHPLYTFVKDTKPGDTNGQGVVAFGAGWFAVSPAGNQISKHSPSAGGGSSSSRAANPAPKAATTPAHAPAPKPSTTPAPAPAPKPATPPAPKPASHASNGIPQNNGGDGDSDNNGGPSDGDGNI